jgi:peptidoglycan/LPS O-acetylase OafA/YrhL
LGISAAVVGARAVARSGAVPPDFWGSLAAHLGWVHNLDRDFLAGFNMPLWSLALEFQLYLLFPVFLLVRERWGLLTLAFITVVLELLYRSAVYPLVQGDDWALNYSLAFAVPGRMFEFVIGIVAAGLVKNVRGNSLPVKVRWLAAVLWAGSGAAALHLTLAFSLYHPAVDVFWGLFFGLTLFLSFVLDSWRAALSTRWLVRCGICSYSVYLIHHPVGLWLSQHFYFAERLPVFARVSVMTLYPLMMVVAGMVCFRFLEQPFLKAKPKA